jgi:hypothetical protein
VVLSRLIWWCRNRSWSWYCWYACHHTGESVDETSLWTSAGLSDHVAELVFVHCDAVALEVILPVAVEHGVCVHTLAVEGQLAELVDFDPVLDIVRANSSTAHAVLSGRSSEKSLLACGCLQGRWSLGDLCGLLRGGDLTVKVGEDVIENLCCLQ